MKIFLVKKMKKRENTEKRHNMKTKKKESGKQIKKNKNVMIITTIYVPFARYGALRVK